MPKPFSAIVAGIVWLCLAAAAPARAECAGQDMMSELRAADPATHQAILSRAHAIPNAQGRFWKVERTGTDPSYLFGTFHTEQALEWVPAEAWDALDVADVAIFELDSTQMDAMRVRAETDPNFMFDPAAVPLSQRVPANVLREIRTALTERGIPGPMGEQMRPWALFSLLSFPVCHLRAQMQGAKAMDQHLQDRASERNIREVGLETYEEALSAFQASPLEELVSLMSAQGIGFDREVDAFMTNLSLYARGEIGAILEFGLHVGAQHAPEAELRRMQDRFLAVLLDQRNRDWMPALERELARGNAFVGVGALHMVGEQGLVELLRDKGYTVTLAAR